MDREEFDIQVMTEARLDGAVALSKAASWPHRREDWALLLGLGTGWVATDAEGLVVGTALFTPFGTTGGAVSMVIVAERLRGRGLGRRLFATALKAAEGRRLRLTATPDGEPLYRSLGFKPFGRVLQFQGPVAAAPEHAVPGVSEAADSDRDAIARLDEAAFGEDRRTLIDALWRVGRFAVLREGGTLRGFACRRAFGRGTLVGPVVAPTAEAAEALIGHLAAGTDGQFLRMDIVGDVGMEPVPGRFGLPQVDVGLVMWTADPTLPAPGTPRTMCLAAQAVG